ncbi:MAG: DNA polymerase III subunit chi [Sideroxydans sp.]
MTKVRFYTGSPDKLRTACRLSQEALQQGMRVLLHVPTDELADELDRLLWHYPATGFMPHCRCHEMDAATMPVVIGRSERFAHSQLLISLHDECPPFFSRFEQVIEIVGQHEADVRLGRERFRFYRDRGLEIQHIRLNQEHA